VKADLEGHRLGNRYVLESLIATGGMAAVWRGHDEILGRSVAIKLLHENLARDPDLLERFRAEAVAAARLSHPGVVRVFDTGVDGDVCYIVMELVEAAALSDILGKQRILETAEIVFIARNILSALGHAHAAGIVHRDVKPSNVLTGNHAVKVTDFGIAKAAFGGRDLTTTGKLLGTAKYLAPEQVAGGKIDGRADLYALGIVMYEMLTGRVPFDAETDLATATLRLTSEPTPPGALRAGIPRDLERLVMKALARDPEARFQTAEEMAAALDRIPLTPSRTHLREQEPPDQPSSFFRSWMLVPLILTVLTAGGVAAGLALGRLEVGGPFLVRAAEESATARAASAPIQGADDFDPEGDGEEHPELLEEAHDGDLETSWKTERYNSADLGGIKSGVGIVFDLGATRRIDGLTLRSTTPGWSFQVMSSDDPSSFSGAIASVDGETTFLSSQTPVKFIPVEDRYFLVWITRLPPAEEGFQATLSEAQFSVG
jgi:tRNA A-37 threonylcarbamoyl transferase component Bud32